MRQKSTDHEEFCKQHFDAWLARADADSRRQWERGADPPDFILTLEGIRYSVEVSRVIDQDRITSSASLHRLVENLKSELVRTAALRGTYIVDPDEPLPAGAWHRRDFRTQIAEFISATQDVSQRVSERIVIAGRSVARVEKYSAEGARLFCNGIGGGGWEDEIRREYEDVASQLLRRKSQRLSRHRPSVLLLQDALCPISPRILREVIRAVPESTSFDVIYVISADERGEIVFVNRKVWPKQYLSASQDCEVA